MFAQTIGYMPFRREFDYEFENEAEVLLSELTNTENESEEDKNIINSILVIYNNRIK